MQDPYRTLGVNRNSSDDAIKEAYRKKATELAPDGYAGNPLSDIAQQKMDELNAAFDQIMAERRLGSRQQFAPQQQQQRTAAGGYGANTRYTTPNPSDAATSPDFYEIRQMLNRNDISGAEHRLLSMPENLRSAEWYFLMGSVSYSKGWLDEANRYYNTACNMEPQNAEYAAARNRMNGRRSGQAAGNPYGGYHTTTNAGGCGGCDVCTGLICADCCCECMGGDLIRCC